MPNIYALGPFRLDAHTLVLFRGTEPIALGQRAVALLRTLVGRAGAMVSKDTLIEAAWPNLAVEESNLTVQIAALRRILSEAPGGEHWIQTLHRRGYRYVGPIVTEIQRGCIDVLPQVEAAADPAATQYDGAERRQITAMSCSLVASAPLPDDTELEDWREAVGTFQLSVAEAVRPYNGFIARHFGNIILALFGYPQAHEDDAERAVRAGLELCKSAGAVRSGGDMSVRCRVGIATGMVIIGEAIGVGGGRDHEIVGNTLDLAARLQILAQPDTVTICSATRQLIGNLFDCRDLDAIETGGTTPTRVWQVLGERLVESRFEALRGSTLSPLIGRDEEIDLLLRRWARAKAGDGQIALVFGEGGIGKSRLAAALGERLQGEPHLRLRYFCSPYHQDSALFPFIDQLGRASGFVRDDPPATRLEKLEALLARITPPDEDVALLADLLSLPASERHPLPNFSPHRKKERTLEALIRQLEGLARQQTIVVIFEDAHWIDPTSRELLDLTVERIRTLPVLLIVTFRPEYQPPWIGQPGVTMLALNRLDRRDRTALVVQIAGGKGLPDEVVAHIVDRTDGVPLFVEELTRNVLESGLLRDEAGRYVLDSALPLLAIPTSLRASLLARLDRLASARHVAQIGAAIGRQFSYPLLHAVSRRPEDELQAALARLVASELVLQHGTPPEAVYSFKHALVQDAAHDSMLRKSRQQLHAQIAEAIETHSPEIIESQPELLAQHYAEAGLVEKSVSYWSRAGQRSAARSSMAEAAAQFNKGIGQLARRPDGPERRRQELEFRSGLSALLRFVAGQAAPETGQAYVRARELWEQLGCPSEFYQVPYGQSRYYMDRGELDRAQLIAEELSRLGRQRNDSAGLLLGCFATGQNLMFAGKFTSSRSFLEEVQAIYDPVSHGSVVHQIGPHPHVGARVYLAKVMFCLGYPDYALASCNAAIAEARRLAHQPSLAGSLGVSARLLSLSGDNGVLGEWVDELNAIATEQGFPYWKAQGTIYLGWVKVKNGGVAEGISLLRNGLNAYCATGAELWRPHHIALLASACRTAGQIDRALNLLEEALQIVERTGERWLAAELYRHKGQLLLRHGYAAAAEELYRKALSLAREQEAKLWELRAAASLARLWRDRGRRPEARDLLGPVYGWFTEGFDTPDLKEAKALLDELT
jgi:class 3 adenylate cyclase/predicted ATPase